MSNKSQNLSSNVGFLVIGGFFSQLVNMFTGILLARVLLQEDFGLYKQLFMVNNLLSPIFLAAIPTSILFFLPRLTKTQECSRFLTYFTQTMIPIGKSKLSAAFSLFMKVDSLNFVNIDSIAQAITQTYNQGCHYALDELEDDNYKPSIFYSFIKGQT